MTEEAERLKFINELEQQGIRLSKEKVDAVLAERKSIRQAAEAAEAKKKEEEGKKNLRTHLKDKAGNLQDAALRQAGRGGQAEREKAIREAEAVKGSALTRQEKAKVTGLADLTWELNSRNAPELGDLSIRTNSLTSRGGFATGVVTPDRDAVNRNIAEYNKKTNELLDKITKIIADIGKF